MVCRELRRLLRLTTLGARGLPDSPPVTLFGQLARCGSDPQECRGAVTSKTLRPRGVLLPVPAKSSPSSAPARLERPRFSCALLRPPNRGNACMVALSYRQRSGK
jgi:hypothetical protein